MSKTETIVLSVFATLVLVILATITTYNVNLDNKRLAAYNKCLYLVAATNPRMSMLNCSMR